MKDSKLFSSRTNLMSLDYSILILRFAAAGFMVYNHGFGKFQRMISGEAIEFMDPFGIGATATFGLVTFAEFLCAVLVFFGLFTRWALIPLIINMAYIAFVFHIDDGFGKQEMPLMYLVMFVVLLLTGPGKHSVDRLINRKVKTI